MQITLNKSNENVHTYTLKDLETGGRLHGKKKGFGGRSGRRMRAGAPDSKAGGVALSKPFNTRHVTRAFGDCPAGFLSCFRLGPYSPLWEW